ncbi:MAG: DUF1800 domain-containing protein [Anaerolineales bacterium]|nr:DUF1800 domain-containing protein [Anaerolineales bacterium]
MQKRRRMGRRAALRVDRLLAATARAGVAVPAAPATGLRAPGQPDLPAATGDPALPSLGVIVYNRLAFGARPGDLAAFNALGGTDDARLGAWINQQTNPGAIDDSECDARLAAAGLATLGKPLPQLWVEYYRGSAGRTVPVGDVRQATFIRAIYSRRQLNEVLADFWHNHFSIYGWDYSYASATWVHFDRDVIRAYMWGNFRQFLQAVTVSPAMLYYLDNYINQVAGYNENWARELFELHTLGSANYLGVMNPLDVPKDQNGLAIGYCDNDVYEAARSFTGWRVNNGSSGAPGDDGTFFYHAAWHDKANKLILGRYQPANQADMADGNLVLDLLASHPGTARYIASKLCRRLVADDPPQTLVDAAAAVFTAAQGAGDQLAQVVRTICLSAEFKAAWGQKVKRPFEAAAGLVRALNADFYPSDDFHWTFSAAGQSLFGHRSPDGYPDRRSDWANTTSLLQRWRLANRLVRNELDDVTVDLLAQMPGGLTTTHQIVDYWISRLLGRPMDPPSNRAPLVDFMAQGRNPDFALPAEQIAERLPHLVALILMAPDFQWR